MRAAIHERRLSFLSRSLKDGSGNSHFGDSILRRSSQTIRMGELQPNATTVT